MALATILLADNDPDFLITRQEFLENKGYRVIAARSPAEARRAMSEGRVQLAILDIRLISDDDEKDVSGLILAKSPAYRSIPKIILTGFQSQDHVREALRPGLNGSPPALDFLAKHEGPDAMLSAVQNSLVVSRREMRPFVVLSLLLGAAVISGIIGIIYANPSWLVGTVTFGILFTLITWQLAIR